jgi:hypothetical protein
MDQQAILANLHLHAVLPNLASVAAFDDQARELTSKWNATIQFAVLGGPAMHLTFDNGTAKAFRKKTSWPTVGFTFATNAQANKMILGKGLAVPAIWGVWHPKVLGGFMKLSKRLEYFMKPSPEVLAKPENKKFIVSAMFDTIIAGIEILGRTEHHCIQFAKGSPKGSLEFRVLPDGPVKHLVHHGGGLITYGDGPVHKPNAILEFMDVDTAWKLLNNEIDPMVALGSTDIRLKGLIPLADNMFAIMDILSRYLA